MVWSFPQVENLQDVLPRGTNGDDSPHVILLYWNPRQAVGHLHQVVHGEVFQHAAAGDFPLTVVYSWRYTVVMLIWKDLKQNSIHLCFWSIPCIMPKSLSLFCCRHNRSKCRTCCWGLQVFFSLSRLLWSTFCPGRLSSSFSRGTEDRRSEDRDWKTASSQRVTSARVIVKNVLKPVGWYSCYGLEQNVVVRICSCPFNKHAHGLAVQTGTQIFK